MLVYDFHQTIVLKDFFIKQKLIRKCKQLIRTNKTMLKCTTVIFYVFLIPLVIFINSVIYADGYGIYLSSELNLYIAFFLGLLVYYLGSKITIKKEQKPQQMKKIFIREVFWFILTIILSLIFSFLFMDLLDLSSSERNLKEIEKIFSVQIYIIGCIVSFISIYIIRTLVALVKMLLN